RKIAAVVLAVWRTGVPFSENLVARDSGRASEEEFGVEHTRAANVAGLTICRPEFNLWRRLAIEREAVPANSWQEPARCRSPVPALPRLVAARRCASRCRGVKAPRGSAKERWASGRSVVLILPTDYDPAFCSSAPRVRDGNMS